MILLPAMYVDRHEAWIKEGRWADAKVPRLTIRDDALQVQPTCHCVPSWRDDTERAANGFLDHGDELKSVIRDCLRLDDRADRDPILPHRNIEHAERTWRVRLRLNPENLDASIARDDA